jgi:hypothetical protein
MTQAIEKTVPAFRYENLGSLSKAQPETAQFCGIVCLLIIITINIIKVWS